MFSFSFTFFRASASEFIVPYRKFSKSFDYSFSVGMRFKTQLETEDAADQRFGLFYLYVLKTLFMKQCASSKIHSLFSGTLG